MSPLAQKKLSPICQAEDGIRDLIVTGVQTCALPISPTVGGLRDALQEMGYRENEHFVIGVRFTQGDPTALPAAARELVQQGTDVLVTSGGGHVAKAAQEATSRLPIVFIGGSDPVALGLVKSFNRPGGNIT